MWYHVDGDYMKKISIFSICFFIVDLLVKILITTNMHLYDKVNIIPNFFSIMYVRNTGAAFSVLENNRILFIIVAIIAVLLIFKYIVNVEMTKFNILCYSMLLGGIIGNLFDRIVYGYVIDYLSFNIFNFNYPVFNLADSFIVISIILLILKEIYGKVSSR